jgi:hypothetical protein
MANQNVQIYLQRANNAGHDPNTAIIDVATQDYLPNLAPEEREDAEQEIELMMWSEDWPDWERRLLLVIGFRALRQRIRALEALQAELAVARAAAMKVS